MYATKDTMACTCCYSYNKIHYESTAGADASVEAPKLYMKLAINNYTQAHFSYLTAGNQNHAKSRK